MGEKEAQWERWAWKQRFVCRIGEALYGRVQFTVSSSRASWLAINGISWFSQIGFSKNEITAGREGAKEREREIENERMIVENDLELPEFRLPRYSFSASSSTAHQAANGKLNNHIFSRSSRKKSPHRWLKNHVRLDFRARKKRDLVKRVMKQVRMKFNSLERAELRSGTKINQTSGEACCDEKLIFPAVALAQLSWHESDQTNSISGQFGCVRGRESSTDRRARSSWKALACDNANGTVWSEAWIIDSYFDDCAPPKSKHILRDRRSLTTKFWRMSKSPPKCKESKSGTGFIISLHFRTIINLFRLSKMSFYFIYVFFFFFAFFRLFFGDLSGRTRLDRYKNEVPVNATAGTNKLINSWDEIININQKYIH